jgi:hypothetical protein
MSSLNGEQVLFGGRNETGVLSDTWTWDGRVWTQVVTGPSARAGAVMATP